MTYLGSVDQLKSKRDNAESLLQQVFSVFSVCYLCISAGNFLGYTSSAVPSIKEDETFLDVSHHDISWIGGLGPLGALFGSLFTLLPLPRLGSRRTVAAFAAPALILSWIIIAFSNSVETIYIGRFLGGTGTGIVIACSPLYVLDVSSIMVRGRLGILPQFMMIFGILTSYILGSFLNWRYLSMACGLISIPSLFLLAFAPDSPVWLISQGRSDEAHAILERLHGSKKAVTLLRQAQDKISQEVIRRQKNDGINKRRLDMTMVKASAVALGILSFQQLTGINAVTFYAVSIFRNTSPAGSTMDAHIPSIILASTQLIASFTSSLLVEKYGRKLLLGVSSIMMATAGTMLGTYFYFQAQLPYLSWVPLASLILFAFGFAVGYGPVSWILVAEILPNEIRHFMNPIAIGYNWFCTFLVTKSFPLLLLEINIYGVFWMFACIALLGLVFVILCVPETKGKTDDEIRRFFGVQCTNYDIDNSFNEEIVDCSENSGGGDGDKETDNIKGNGEQV